MEISFLGAAQNVTGSRFLLESNGSRVLVDCGLYQERAFQARNWEPFPVEPSGIDCCLLTHAHIDHCGYLPKFVREGFKGKIFCTRPTAEITRISLMDSARMQEENAEFKRRRHEKEKRESPYTVVPLYTTVDAQNVFEHFEPVSYGEDVGISGGISASFHDAGHILGAAMIELKVREGGREKKCVFSGDIGRWNRPLIGDPTVFREADHVFMESTYGNRLHEKEEVSIDKLQRIITQTKESGGNVIIPTFAVERAQELLLYISQLLREDRIPHLMVFIDSPMAIEVTEVFKKYPEYFDEKTRSLMKKTGSPFEFPMLMPTRTVDESKAINHIKGTSIIMAGSGMCTGGRIKHHLVNNITRPESTIVFVGYQAEGTLGRQILERPKEVRILGHPRQVRARVEKINGFSAHADKDELLRWVSGFKKRPETIFVIHGEKKVSEEFASDLNAKYSNSVVVPEYLERYPL